MSKVVIDDSKLVNIANAIRNKNGSANKYTPTEMATAIGEIKVSTGAELAPEDLVISGDCRQRFYNNGWNWYIEKFGDKITTKDITNAQSMFHYSNHISSIPFSLNFKEGQKANIDYVFADTSIASLPSINNLTVESARHVFYDCQYLTEVPEYYFDTWDFSYLRECYYLFASSPRLKKIPSDLSMLYSRSSNISYDNSFYRGTFYYCRVLEKATNLPVELVTLSSNAFSSTFLHCDRLKRITFSLNNGTPKIASWQKQTIDLSQYVGYSDTVFPPSNYGMPLDTQIKNDATYQLLKDNEDSWTSNIKYSRYNHDSAVETINTLPDTSAYLAESGGTTNIIKFEGASGSATDGGAINTLTEAEIAVAAAKGWTVTLV